MTKTPEKQQQRFFPVPIGALDHDVLMMDLYIKFGGAPTLYRSAGLAFTPEDTNRLLNQNVKFLYVSAAQHHIFRKALADRLDRTFADPNVAKAERGRVIREACSKMIEDVLLFPGDSEPVSTINDISRNFVEWSSSDPDGFTYLLNMSSHDFYTATHMVNVGVGCGLLAKELFPEDREFFQLCVQGGLLHDIGKRNVPTEILTKEGKLEAEEWRQIRAHPTNGFEELRKNPAIPEMVLLMARDHHERLDGKGYPSGLSAVDLSPGARICAIVDVFDAITAARPYRGPTPPTDTLKIMSDGKGNQFDPVMFEAWTRVVHRMLDADPARAPAASPNGPQGSLDGLLPKAVVIDLATAAANTAVNLYADERRRHTRHAVQMTVNARLIRSLKVLPIKPGDVFSVRVLDLGRGGIQIKTPWPLSLNDLIAVDFAVPGQRTTLTRMSRVVRVRKTDDGQWAAGMAFVDSSAAAA